MYYEEIIHAVSVGDVRQTDHRSYFASLLSEHNLEDREFIYDVEYDVREIDRLYGHDDALWQEAFDRLTREHEIWVFTFPATPQEFEHLSLVRNGRGRKMFV